MTIAERQILQMLREDVETGFAEMREGFKLINGRVRTLEMKGAAVEAVEDDRRQIGTRVATERRWRISFVVGLVASISFGALNAVLLVVRP